MRTSKDQSEMIVHPRAAEMIAPSAGEFQMIQSDQKMQEVTDLIDDNMAGQKMSLFNLSQIKVPSGGGLAFTVDSASGRQSEREVKGVIVAFRQARVYWKRAYGSGGGKKPPDCSSQNGLVGVGDPGGDCTMCPNNEFGTALNPDGSRGAGMACKDIRQLLLVRPDQFLPHVLSVPPTSIKAFDQYIWNLTSEGLRYWAVVTRIVPEMSVSSGGIDFARLRFLKERPLEAAQTQRLLGYHQRMQGFLRPLAVEATAYEEEAPSEREESEVPY